MVLVKDRHPGGKFRLPFEEELWTVTALQQQETVKVSREIYPSSKSFPLNRPKTRPGLDPWTTPCKTPRHARRPWQRARETPVTVKGYRLGGRYHLRSNLDRSRRYADFIFD
ncbi:hypothetical protein NDU88_003478 [Pleurodeles waltl]|uniref:Uncharacterized protein n=1 Tax=Pleurodeles waltl TaxID=8319 RepID=A0AAV7TP55_PLEWA|nr:hypothetical protein NDU88_003478 [Pleurodeles waltl]